MTGRPLLVAVVVLALGLVACQGCRSTGGAGSAPRSGGGDPGPPNVRLYLLSDLAGALEPCGCTKDQLGGLDHFGAWVKSERAHAPAALVAAAGPLFFMDDKLEGDRADQDRAKAETIARVLRGLDFAAFAPGTNDWNDGAGGLEKLAAAAGATAVVGSTEPLVREIGGVKVGFVGFGQQERSGAGSPADAGPVVVHAVASAKARGANVIVALVAVGRGEAKRIADMAPDLTAIVVGSAKARGDGNTNAAPPEFVGPVLVLQGANHLQTAVVLDLYVREPPSPGNVIHFADGTGLELSRKRDELARRIDELHVRIAAWERDPSVPPGDVAARKRELADLEHKRDALEVSPLPEKGSFFRYASKEIRESLGKDAATLAEMASYYKAIDEHNRTSFAGRLPPPLAPLQAGYVGIAACTECHAPATAVWRGTAHARAYQTLSSQFKEFNLECVGCHVTGYERPGGSTVTHVDKLRDVQCEVCHGPGSKHVLEPLDSATIVAKPEPSLCAACHHPPHVEGFDAASKMHEILGPGHGKPLKENSQKDQEDHEG